MREKAVKSLENILNVVTGTAYSDIKEVCREFEIFSDKKKCIRNIAKLGFSVGISIPPYVLVHEFMHAGAAKLLGADKIKISLDNSVGGGLLEKFMPVQGENLLFEEKCFGYCDWRGLNKVEETLTLYAPYLLTPIGISIMYAGIRKKNIYLTGVGMLVGIKPLLDLGFRASFDLSQFGMNIYYGLSNYFFFPENPGEVTRIACMLGTMAGTYYVSKKIVKGVGRGFERLRIKNKQ